ncbi:MAG: MarC family protein [Bacteroides stercoris]
METLIPFALLCFTSFFTLTNPLGTMPVFLTMTQGMTDKERCSIVKRATLVSAYHIDGLRLCRAIPLQVFRYFDKRFPNNGWRYHFQDWF